ncbi:MAG: TonB-dependent receptor [Pedobacter sp.]|nr:TonB-dependent receptor [Chitinophagaceae bacterium]
MKKIVALLSVVLIFSSAIAQKAKITGKITNSRNEGLAGVTVKAGYSTTQSNVDGQFTIAVNANKNIEITFSYVGYKLKTITDLTLKAGAEESLNILLEDNSKKLDEVVVKSAGRGSAKGETVNALIAFQKNTNTVASVISAEAIKRSPDRNTGEVLKRTPGASIQEGKFLIIRGLADRYNSATLNGVLLGSTEPDRKAFSFDLIPANMIDNIIINKAFVPELPGEWAGGLVQVNTKDIPSKNFFSLQVGGGFNTQTHFSDYSTYKKGKTDWLGIDDGTRSLPAIYTTKGQFDILTAQQKTTLGTQFQNNWSVFKTNAVPNIQLQSSGGFTAKLKGNQQLGGILGITYSRNNRQIKQTNNGFNFIGTGAYTPDFTLNDDKYTDDVLMGALGNLSYQLNNYNKISLKSIININSTSFTTLRTGLENNSNPTLDNVQGYELAFKQNTFWNSQLSGEHSFKTKPIKIKWYGSFTVLDGFVPNQRRAVYQKNNSIANSPYVLLLSNVLSQKSGSIFYQSLNEYTYAGGGDISYGFNAFGKKQTVKAGYMLQIKDRLFDAKPFSIYLPRDNYSLRLHPLNQVFAPTNFGDGSTTSTQLAFDAIKGNQFRYLANTILNAGYVQFDNQFAEKLRIVWGVRVEDYDQLIGSVKKSDPRYNYSRVTDFLPGLNATYKLNNFTNIRFSASQTVVRPEFRELAIFQFYDFDLNASIQGNPNLVRTKISNLDLRYEWYPKAGEVVTVGAFYKYFDKPIELVYNFGAGGASTFNFQNPDKATAFGLELELRKKLDFNEALKNFTLQTNISYIYSKVQDPLLKLDRQLQGQSPYLLNLGLLYDLPKQGINATLLYNQIGRRIAFVGNNEQPDTYEAPRPILDFQVSKKFANDKAEFKLNVADILNQTLYFYQNPDGKAAFDKANDPYRFTKKYGTTFSVTFGYTL